MVLIPLLLTDDGGGAARRHDDARRAIKIVFKDHVRSGLMKTELDKFYGLIDETRLRC